jgi:hypothetical protein
MKKGIKKELRFNSEIEYIISIKINETFSIIGLMNSTSNNPIGFNY